MNLYMLKRTYFAFFLMMTLLLTGCGENSSSKSKLFNGKCEGNQTWIANLVDAISVPADWQKVEEVTNYKAEYGDFWGLQEEGSTFTYEESVAWAEHSGSIFMWSKLGKYAQALESYEKLLPLMEKMDIQCSIVTGDSVLN